MGILGQTGGGYAGGKFRPWLEPDLHSIVCQLGERQMGHPPDPCGFQQLTQLRRRHDSRHHSANPRVSSLSKVFRKIPFSQTHLVGGRHDGRSPWALLPPHRPSGS